MKKLPWRLLLLLYVLGVFGDLTSHAVFYLSTGDHRIESYEWIESVQASLFWPIDLVAQGLLALR
jgi:hypothetical protein